MRAFRFLLPELALLAALASGNPTAAATRCPTQTFLGFRHLVYAAQELPASVAIAPAGALGQGRLDEPVDPSGCKRRQESSGVERADGIDPRVAIMAAGRPRTIFVLGARCAGYEDGRWDCLQHPLDFGGRRYTGTRYPPQPAPRRTVSFGHRLGEAQLEDKTVSVVQIEGVDPSLAVGVLGRPTEAFLAPGVCPYERFENAVARDDLLRCLRSPVWLTFDPPGASVGAQVTAESDRPLGPELAGATFSLVRLPAAVDVVPRNRAGAVRMGALRRRLTVTVPDLPAGLYEAVVTCRRCATSHRGRTLFPAGSLLVPEKPKSAGGARIVTVGLGIGVLGLGIASIVVWRKGRRRPPSAPGSARS